MNTNKQQNDEPQNATNENRTHHVTEDATKEPAEMKQEEENDGNKTTMKIAIQQDKEKSEKEEGDCCSICLDELPTDVTQFVRWTCCGKGMHFHCETDLDSMGMGDNCPLCRAKSPTTDEEGVNYLRPWVKNKG